MAPDQITRRRALLVDDNQAIHDDFRKILAQPTGATEALDQLEAALFDGPAAPAAAAVVFDLDSAYQGQEALELVVAARASGRPYGLAFVDMRMPPGWDGLETIERLWQVDPDLQVVICTAYSDYSWEEVRARLGERDALLILKKPFDSIEVIQIAHALTAKWVLAQAARERMEDLESAVKARTSELEAANRDLAEAIRRRDRVEAELRLAQKLEAVGQLAAGIAHEINTPIQFVGDSLDFVRDGALSLMQLGMAMRKAAAEAQATSVGQLTREIESLVAAADLAYLEENLPDALNTIQHGIDRVTNIVRAMKELAHPGPRRQAPTDINHALKNALAVTAGHFRYMAEVTTDFAELPPVTCDAGEMNQVFLNLIINAAHAMEERPLAGGQRNRLVLTTRLDGDDAVVSISDTGLGIPARIRERVFDAFFTTKEVGRGTGQGLAIAHSIVVDRHNGRLTFDSEVGVGTTFHVRIPVAGAQAAAVRRRGVAAA